MAVPKDGKKRKASTPSTAVAVDPPSKKSKSSAAKSGQPTEEAKSTKKHPSKATEEKKTTSSSTNVSAKNDGDKTRQIKPRKRAVDFLSDDESDLKNGEAPNVSSTPAKPSKKKSKKTAESANLDNEKTKEAIPGSDKNIQSKTQAKGEKKTEEKFHEKSEAATESADEDNDEEENDQTAALIQGFESSDEEDASNDEGFKTGQDVPAIPDAKQMKRKLRRMKKNATEQEEPGTVYVGRIPHGFYEHEMRAYFSQFGPITRLRLSRNRTTGRSKHYAFVEFSSSSTAKIVAETMDNYLMFGHILKCKYIPQEQVHSELWKGANRRFKKTPWNNIEKKRLEAGKTRSQWSKKIEQEEAKRSSQAEKMKELGYEFEIPKLKDVAEVPVKEPAVKESGKKKPAAIEAPSKKENETPASETALPKSEGKKSKKEKETTDAVNDGQDQTEKGKKKGKNQQNKDITATSDKVQQDEPAQVEKKSEKKSSKGKSKKSKA